MENTLYLCGDAAAMPVVSHESHGVTFCTFPLRVERLSGASDNYETIVAAWDDAMLTAAADETEELRAEARKKAAESRGRRVSAAAEAF